MRIYRRLRVRLAKRDREELDGILSGGVQPVRVLLRGLALRQLHDGKAVSEVAAHVRLTPKAVREIGWRYENAGLDRALHDRQRPGAQTLLQDKQRQRIIAMVCSDPHYYPHFSVLRLVTPLYGYLKLRDCGIW